MIARIPSQGLAEAIGALAHVKDDRLVLLVVGKPDPAPYRKQAEGSALLIASSSRPERMTRMRITKPPIFIHADATRSVQPGRPRGIDDGIARHQHSIQRGMRDYAGPGARVRFLPDPADLRR